MTDLYLGALGRGLFKKKNRGARHRAQVAQEWANIGVDIPGGTPWSLDAGGNPTGKDFFERGINALDELGYSGGLPGSDIAPEVQLMADAKAARRNLALARQGLSQGMNALQAGQETLSSYRQGGAAALTSGLFQSQADLSFRGALAQQQEAPDLMFRNDERRRKSAEAKAKNAALTSGLIGLAGTVLGAGLTAGAAINAGSPPPVALGLNFAGTQGNPNQYMEPIGPPGGNSVSQAGPGLAPRVGPPTAQQQAASDGGGGVNVQQWGQQAAGGAGVGGGGTIQSAGGPQGGGAGGPAPRPVPGPVPGPAPGGGKPQGAPGGGAGGPTAGPMRWNGVSMRGGDVSGAVGPTQIGLSQDLQLPADVMNAIFEQHRREPSTADIFDAMFWRLVGGAA